MNINFIVSILIVLVLMIVMSFFVMAEIAFLTLAKHKLNKMINTNVVGAKQVYKIIQNPERLLSTVQIAITLLGLILGFFSGEYLSDYIVSLLNGIAFFKEYSNVLGHIILFITMTYFTVMSEILPKRIAMLHPEKIACYTSFVMIGFMKLVYPIVYLLTLSVHLGMKIFKIKDYGNKVSVDEIKFLINQAAISGTFKDEEKDMFRRFIHVGYMLVGAIMTPRNKLVVLDINKDANYNIKLLKKYKFSYFPVINKDLNNLIGIVSTKDVMINNINNHNFNYDMNLSTRGILNQDNTKYNSSNLHNDSLFNTHVENLAKKWKILYVPEVSNLTNLIILLKENNTKISVVIDEYGDIEGIVTFSDIIKTFIGNVGNSSKDNERNVIKKKDGSFTMDGNILIEEVMEQLDLLSLPYDNDEDYRTLASFMLKQFDKIPKAGDSFVSVGWKFTVMKMDKFRIDKVKIIKDIVN